MIDEQINLMVNYHEKKTEEVVDKLLHASTALTKSKKNAASKPKMRA